MTGPPKKHPRDYGGSFSLNNPDDGTPIREFIKVDGNLLIITDKCTYSVRLADQIDPKRENPALPPNVQQKLFDHGVGSDLLCRTLLQAKVLFRGEFQKIDNDEAIRLALEAFGNLISMHEAAQSFEAAEKGAIEKTQALQRKDASLTLPSVGNARDACKTFMQKADHFCLALLNIMRIFFPELKGKGWDAFHELVKARFGEEDLFFKVSESAVPLFQLVRNARDAFEHNPNAVTTRDFELQSDGTVMPPSIEIDFRKSRQECCPISWFMAETTKALAIDFEMLIVHASSKNCQPFAGMPMIVNWVPEDQRSSWRVRFAYGAFYEDGKFVPCG